MKYNAKTIVLCGLFSALAGIGAFIKFPIPYVPISLQSFFTTLAGLLLGSYLGAASVAVYIIIGLIGIPVFTQGGGLSYVFQPTFGYLLGFALGAFVTGKFVENKEVSYFRSLIACIIGMLAIYAIGVPYFYVISNYFINKPIGVSLLFKACFLSTLPGDLIKCFICAYLATKLIPIIRKNNLHKI